MPTPLRGLTTSSNDPQDSKLPELFTMALLKRVKRTVTTPGEAEEILQRRLATLGMTFQEYVASLISYDCWAEKPHMLTGDACKGSKAGEERLWQEIIRDFGKTPKTGSYFEHRVAELVLAKFKA